MTRNAAILAAAIAITITTVAGPATADGSVEGDGGALNVYADNGNSGTQTPGSPASPTGDGGTETPGRWVSRMVCEVGGAETCMVPATCPSGEIMYYNYFVSPDGTVLSGSSSCGGPAAPVAGPAPPQVTPGMVLRAFERIPLPESELNVQPPNGRTLVNFETNFFTEEQDLDESLTLVGQDVDLRIWADSYTWSWGDGEQLTTSETGAPYPKLQVTHRYASAEEVDVALDTTYAADYRVNGGAWAPVPGTVTIEGTPESLEVVEATPRLVGYQ